MICWFSGYAASIFKHGKTYRNTDSHWKCICSQYLVFPNEDVI